MARAADGGNPRPATVVRGPWRITQQGGSSFDRGDPAAKGWTMDEDRMTGRSRARLVTPALTAVVALLAGCGQGNSTAPTAAGARSSASAQVVTTTQASTASTAATAGHSTVDGCGQLPASTVGAALGESLSAPTARGQGTVVLCMYRATSGYETTLVRIETGVDRSAFDRSKAAYTAQFGKPVLDVAGLLDTAFSTSLASPAGGTINTVTALRGSVDYLVSSHASVAAEKALIAELGR